MRQATLVGGWDVVAAQEGGLTNAAWRDAFGGDGLTGVGRPLTLRRGQPLHRADRACRQFYVLIEVRCRTQIKGKACALRQTAKGLCLPCWGLYMHIEVR